MSAPKKAGLPAKSVQQVIEPYKVRDGHLPRAAPSRPATAEVLAAMTPEAKRAVTILVNSLFKEIRACCSAWEQAWGATGDLEAAKIQWVKAFIENDIRDWQQVEYGLRGLNYHAGRPENGYPKIRNPNLVGVACKHVLRVMAEIEGAGLVLSFLQRAIEKGRSSETGAGSIRANQKETDAQAAKQAARPTARGARSGDRDYDRSRAALRKASRSTTTRPKTVAGGSKRVAALATEPAAQETLLAIIKQLGITQEQAIAILKGASNAK